MKQRQVHVYGENVIQITDNFADLDYRNNLTGGWKVFPDRREVRITVSFETHSSNEPHPEEPVFRAAGAEGENLRRGRAGSYLRLEWAAGVGAFALALLTMWLFLMNTVANRVDTLIEQQNTVALKLSDDLHYFDEQRNTTLRFFDILRYLDQQQTTVLRLSDILRLFDIHHDQQQTTVLRLSDILRFFDIHHTANAEPDDHDTWDSGPIPPGLFSDIVEFSRNTAIIMLEVHRLDETLNPLQWHPLQGLRQWLQSLFGSVKEGDQPSKSWSDIMLTKLTPKDKLVKLPSEDGQTQYFTHIGVDPRTTSNNIVEAGNYQIELYQSLRDYSQERCTAYKDNGGAISTYLLPLLFALLGAALCDLRCRQTRMPGDERGRNVPFGSTHYTTAIIAGTLIGIFTSLIPTSLSLPPLLVAFLFGYSVDTFTGWLDTLIHNLPLRHGAT
jgi:hypothetical protein